MGDANKLLLPLDGRPLVCHAVASLLPVVEAVVVVTGHERDAVASALQDMRTGSGAEGGADKRDAVPPVRTVHNPDYTDGMGASIARGVAAVGDTDGVLIHLGDVPLVRPDTVERLARAFAETEPPAIVIPVHDGRRGHPVLFAAAFRKALTNLSGDTGARPVVQAHPEAVVEVHVDDPGIHRDIDTRETYQSLRPQADD